MRCFLSLSVVLAAALAAASVPAEEHATIVRGTEGLVAVPFRADNEGPGDLECKAALAHWYSFELGRVGPGASVTGTLWYDPTDGDILLLNDLKDHIPVQMLWCGAWDRRAVIALERKAGGAPAPIHVTCSAGAARLECR